MTGLARKKNEGEERRRKKEKKELEKSKWVAHKISGSSRGGSSGGCELLELPGRAETTVGRKKQAKKKRGYARKEAR